MTIHCKHALRIRNVVPQCGERTHKSFNQYFVVSSVTYGMLPTKHVLQIEAQQVSLRL